MKKTKMFLTGLIAGSLLFSTAPSFAVRGPLNHQVEKDIQQKEYSRESLDPKPFIMLDYEEKVERIANYLTEIEKMSTFNLNIPHISYGLHTAVLEAHSKANDKYIKIEIYEESTLNMAFFSEPKLLLVDVKGKEYNSSYGSLDWVMKKDKEDYVVVDLTKEEKEKFNNLYLNIIDKFYLENEKKMNALNKALEQNKDLQELFEIIEQK